MGLLATRWQACDAAEVGFLIGNLRDPVLIRDIVPERLFDDGLLFVVRKDHPILTNGRPGLGDMFSYPIVVATEGTPTRRGFDDLAARFGPPASLEKA